MKLGSRKIQKIRKSQFINLPKIWTENNNTKKGDVVEVRLEKDGSLNLRIASVTACKHATDAADTAKETSA